MEYEYCLVWHSQYGKEEIDAFETLEEATAMRSEYEMAYGGLVTIKQMRVK